MATVTPNFNWPVPTSTDLVKDGATAIEALGDSIDASLVDLKGGTTGQVLAKASGTDMDFSWVAQDDSNAIQNTIVDAKGDLIAATAADTPARLAVGTNGQVLTADSTAATGLAWATPASGGSTYSGCSAYRSSSQVLTGGAYTAIQWNAEHWDTNSYHDNATNPSRFTVPSGKAGYYSFKFNLGIGAITGDNYFHIRVNGTTKWNFSWDTNSPTNLQGNATLNLAVADYVELFVYNVSSISTAANDEALCSFDYLGA
jgi:hypothetical protein